MPDPLKSLTRIHLTLDATSPAPESETCPCGETVDPWWNPIFGRWILNPECDPCIYAEQIGREWDRAGQTRRLFRGTTPAGTLRSYTCPPGDRAALKIVAGWDASTGLFLSGPPGHGKTHLATAAARKWARVDSEISIKMLRAARIPDHRLSAVLLRVAEKFPDGPPGQERHFTFTTVPGLLDRIRATYDRENNENTEALIHELMDADLLVLDDLGAEKSTEWASEKLFRIIDHRLVESKPTIITSNLTLGKISRRYREGEFPTGERLASRIAGACTVLEVGARGDYRMRQKT